MMALFLEIQKAMLGTWVPASNRGEALSVETLRVLDIEWPLARAYPDRPRHWATRGTRREGLIMLLRFRELMRAR
jgi:hypothetical protein